MFSLSDAAVPTPAALSVASTNDPFGSAFVRVSVAVVTPLSASASHSGMLSPVTGFVVAADTLFTVQSVAAKAFTRQTGSLNVTVSRLPDAVKLLKVGRVVSVYV